MNAFTHLLETLRGHAQSEREKGAYFECLVQIFLTVTKVTHHLRETGKGQSLPVTLIGKGFGRRGF